MENNGLELKDRVSGGTWRKTRLQSWCDQHGGSTAAEVPLALFRTTLIWPEFPSHVPTPTGRPNPLPSVRGASEVSGMAELQDARG